MKTNLLSLGTVFGLALVPVTTLAAEGGGVYYNADLGGTIIESTSLKEFPDAPPGGKVEFNPGVRLSLGGGFRFNEWLSLGGETGFSFNSIDGADATVSQVPFLANVEFRLPNKTPLVPFFGGGPGMSFSGITIDDDSIGNGSRVDGSASDAVFAWQAYGGVRYKLNDNMSVGVIYKYLYADSTNWDVDGTSQDMRFGETSMHTISGSFSMDF